MPPLKRKSRSIPSKRSASLTSNWDHRRDVSEYLPPAQFEQTQVYPRSTDSDDAPFRAGPSASPGNKAPDHEIWTIYGLPFDSRTKKSRIIKTWIGLLPADQEFSHRVIKLYENDPESVTPVLGYEPMEPSFRAESALMSYGREKTMDKQEWHRRRIEHWIKQKIFMWKCMILDFLLHLQQSWSPVWEDPRLRNELDQVCAFVLDPTHGLLATIREYRAQAAHLCNELREWAGRVQRWHRERIQLRDRIREALRGNTRNSMAEAIEALKMTELNKVMLGPDGAAVCAICWGEVEISDFVLELPCKHWYHDECVLAWLRERGICPYCGRLILLEAAAPAAGYL